MSEPLAADHSAASGATSQPRVAVIGPTYPHRGGIAHYTTCLVSALTEAGCRTQVIAFRRLYPRWLFPGRNEFDPSQQSTQVPSERILAPLNPLRWLAALRAIRHFSPDLVVVTWWHSWFLPCTVFCLLWLRWIQHRRVALLCHNVRSHDHSAADTVAWPVLSRLPHTHIVHASGDPAQIRARNPKARVIRLPHPIYEIFTDARVTREEARRRLGLEPGDEVCLFFGLVRRYKGLDIAIEALGTLTDRPNLRLLVAGEFYEPLDYYVRMIRRLRLTERVILHDHYIPNEQVALYFRAADVLLAPYRATSHSGVVQVARGFGLPVIASAVGGMSDLVSDGETGLLVAPADLKALATAIARFFDQGLAARFRQNYQLQKGMFSWSDLAQTIRRLACDSC